MGQDFDLGLPTSEPPPYVYSHAYKHRPSRRLGRWQVTALFLSSALGIAVLTRIRWTNSSVLSIGHQTVLEDGLSRCAQLSATFEARPDIQRDNPRWSIFAGQKKPVLLHNATLFDGEAFLPTGVDILFGKGIVRSITPMNYSDTVPGENIEILDLHGRYVTPGLVDMHSHHLVWPFHSLPATRDVNEAPRLGPLTPFVRSFDGFKPYDPAIEIIASGGVTSSLILPASANIMGGEAYVVKNAFVNGKRGEPVVEELLIDYGVPREQRQRYAKMACGENPKHTYLHTRLGNTWLLREHFSKAQDLIHRQNQWCQAASAIAKDSWLASGGDGREPGSLPEDIKYESTIAILRGQVNVNIHCYEPEDIERMLAVLHEFGVHPRAFHHALEAWQVPEFLKQQERNITIATFAENAFFKAEAYNANLRAGKILADHDVPVAFKSDHTGEGNNIQYLLHQAAVAHSFGMPAVKALQAVTSVPARSIQQSHRIGGVKPGYDADIAVWDSYPLSIGATAVEVFIDGRATIGISQKDLEVTELNRDHHREPRPRPTVLEPEKHRFCTAVKKPATKLVITGIAQVDLETYISPLNGHNLTLVIDGGKITCLGSAWLCSEAATDGYVVELQYGHITPGLIAVSQTLGVVEITGEPTTSDGVVDPKADLANEDTIIYAKYGVHLEGRGFERARLGGVTKAVAAPGLRGGLLQGISVGFSTSGKKSVLDGGIFQDDVALHFELSQASKAADPTISNAIARLRRLLSNAREHDKEYLYTCSDWGDSSCRPRGQHRLDPAAHMAQERSPRRQPCHFRRTWRRSGGTGTRFCQHLRDLDGA